MNKRCILCVATGDWYERGLDRLEVSLRENSPDVGALLWKGVLPNDCPSHETAPYAFKARAMVQAREMGFTKLVWCDAVCLIVRQLDPLFDEIDKRHVVAFGNPVMDPVGVWCTDRAVKLLGTTREKMMSLPGIDASVIGVDLEHKLGREFLDYLLEVEECGALWGPWKRTGDEAYDNEHISTDPRVVGHRHDQPPIMLFLDRHGIEPIDMPRLFAHQRFQWDETTVIRSEGV